MCPFDYHYNGSMTTHALGHMMFYTLLVNQKMPNKLSKEHYISGHKWSKTHKKGKADNDDMKNVKQKVLQGHILQDDHKAFLEDVEVRLIDKGSDPTKSEYYWMRTLEKLCTQMV